MAWDNLSMRIRLGAAFGVVVVLVAVVGLWLGYFPPLTGYGEACDSDWD